MSPNLKKLVKSLPKIFFSNFKTRLIALPGASKT